MDGQVFSTSHDFDSDYFGYFALVHHTKILNPQLFIQMQPDPSVTGHILLMKYNSWTLGILSLSKSMVYMIFPVYFPVSVFRITSYIYWEILPVVYTFG